MQVISLAYIESISKAKGIPVYKIIDQIVKSGVKKLKRKNKPNKYDSLPLWLLKTGK